jgi:photosystem II stability/assembly factor-like uncharacterized protein
MGDTSGSGVLRTTDGGRRWQASGLGPNFVDALAVDQQAGTIYAAAWDPELSGSGEYRVLQSGDGGRSWREPSPGLTTVYIGALAIDPGAPATLYAGTDRGVFKSLDGGRNWRHLGLAKSGDVAAVAIHPRQPAALYAATRRRGVFMSADGGRTWRNLDLERTTRRGASLAISPDGSVLYVGTDDGVVVHRLEG